MHKIKLTLSLLMLLVSIKGMAQNDCVDAIIICGPANLSNLETVGIGTQEISPFNACASEEHNSIWLKIRIRTGGTLGFVITPETADLVIDFDFWIYGPNRSCSDLGTAIRCSTTNPLQAGLNYNTTGMDDISADISEGPGPDGNAYIHWMNVNDDDIYYIAIDRPVGESNFSIAWTGTATFYTPPIAEAVPDLHTCGNPNLPDGTALFDLTPNGAASINGQTQVVATYHKSYNDAVTAANPINNPNAFLNSINPQKIYIRLTNTATGCFDTTDFDLYVETATTAITGFSYDTPVCLKGIMPQPHLVSGFTAGGTFTAVPQGLAIDAATGIVSLGETIPGKYTISYSIDENNTGCYTPAHSEFDLEINYCEIPKGISPNNDQLNDFFDLSGFDVKELTIFNRYGMKVYHMPNYKKEWNGLSDKGKELPDATYYYLVELNSGEKKTGWVYLQREYK